MTTINESNILDQQYYNTFTGPEGANRRFPRSVVFSGLEWVATILGVPSLYPIQKQSILSVFIGITLMLIQPTGFGKTLCFWGVPILYDYCYNRTSSRVGCDKFYPRLLVISPTSSLMQTHCDEFNDTVSTSELGWSAGHVSDLQVDEKVINKIQTRDTSILIVYMSVETLFGSRNGEVLTNKQLKQNPYFNNIKLYGAQLCGIILDEAHTVLDWKHSFRVAYQQLLRLRALYSKMVWAMITATLTIARQRQLVEFLCLDDKKMIKIIGIATRPNIYLDIINVKSLEDLADVIGDRYLETGDKTLIYSNKSVMHNLILLLSDMIGQYEGMTGGKLAIDNYASSLSLERKQRVLKDWMSLESFLIILVATNALGMGNNMPELRHVLDAGFCRELDAFFQEAGRSGRDGKPATACVTTGLGELGDEAMRKYRSSTDQCLRLQIARHFNPEVDCKILRSMQPGDTEQERAYSCCCICRRRGTQLNPDQRETETKKAEVEALVCPTRCASDVRGSGPFCSSCGHKLVSAN